jgi:hypothetical protein
MEQTRHLFARRANSNGTHDSVCQECFEVIASVKDELQPAQHELNHVCDPVLLYQLREDPAKFRHRLDASRPSTG